MQLLLTGSDGRKTTVGEGTVVDIAGVKFRIIKILSRGRILLKSLATAPPS
jgi:hypothetical protein